MAADRTVPMRLDEGSLAPLLDESDDLHADAMRSTSASVAELVELGRERRRAGVDPTEGEQFAADRERHMPHAFGGRLLLAAGAGTALAVAVANSASAAEPVDVQILRTAASIEVLAAATYSTALTLPFIGGASANKVITAFARRTMDQHAQHLAAFNAAIAQLGGRQQHKPDPVLLKVVERAKPGLTDASKVVALALELEQGAAATYVANVSALSDRNAKAVTASIMGVEAQHASILLAVQALLAGGAPQLIALPPSPLGALPAAAGAVGFPNAFFPTTNARPRTEGARS